MAELNLIPNLPVLAVQTGVFLVNLGIIKKFFVDPYLIVRDSRDRLTMGNRDDAGKYTAESESISREITQRLADAMALVRKNREQIKADALLKRQSMINLASSTAKERIQRIESAIKADVDSERTRIPEVISRLTDEIYRSVVN